MLTLTNISTGETRTVSLAEAAEAARLNAEEIEWAIEEEGLCSTSDFEIRAAGVKYPGVEVELVGRDGNAFAVMGATIAALRNAKVPAEEISKYREQAMSGDYNNLLQTTMCWVNVS